MTIRTLPASRAIRAEASRREGFSGWLRRLQQAAESRRQLAQMDARMLADIGISRAEALEEAARAPWDLSPRRR